MAFGIWQYCISLNITGTGQGRALASYETFLAYQPLLRVWPHKNITGKNQERLNLVLVKVLGWAPPPLGHCSTWRERVGESLGVLGTILGAV